MTDKTLYLVGFEIGKKGGRYSERLSRKPFLRLVWLAPNEPNETIKDKLLEHFQPQFDEEISIINLQFSEAIQ